MQIKPLDSILADVTVSEAMWNSFSRLFVERNGALEAMPSPFQSAAEFEAVVRKLSQLASAIRGSHLSFDGILGDGSRFHVTLPPLSPSGPTLTIRKFTKAIRGFSQLVGSGFISAKLGLFLEACIKGRMNIVISGATGAGKTTLLNALISLVDQGERLITVEDIPEIQLQHPNWVQLLAVRGENPVTVRDCLIGCLRMRPDRIIIGECRSLETLDMLQAMNTGHDGGLTTIHANSSEDALTRLESLILFHAGVEIPMRALRKQIADAVDIVIQVKKGSGGRRYVEDVMEVVGMEGDQVTRLPLFKIFDRKQERPQIVSTGHPPTFLSKLEARGVKLPKGFFDPKSLESVSGIAS